MDIQRQSSDSQPPVPPENKPVENFLSPGYNLPVNPIPLPEPPPEKKFWGGWATLGFGVTILIVFFAAQIIVTLGFIIANPDVFLNTSALEALSSNGLLLSLATLVSAPAGIAIIIVFIRARKKLSVSEYLGLNKVTGKTVLAMVGISVLLFFVLNYVANLFAQNNNSTDQYTLDAYRTVWPPLFWIATVVFAPAFEECFFRGFLFVGLQNSKVGTVGTILITAALWSILHYTQYQWAGVALIFVFGIGLGFIRVYTKSLWNTIIAHALWNFATMVIVALTVGGYIK
jgi:uncharacterized protein